MRIAFASSSTGSPRLARRLVEIPEPAILIDFSPRHLLAGGRDKRRFRKLPDRRRTGCEE